MKRTTAERKKLHYEMWDEIYRKGLRSKELTTVMQNIPEERRPQDFCFACEEAVEVAASNCSGNCPPATIICGSCPLEEAGDTIGECHNYYMWDELATSEWGTTDYDRAEMKEYAKAIRDSWKETS